MRTRTQRRRRDDRKRAVVAVQVAVMMAAILGFAALTVDVGAMYNTRADLQRTADASALAAAALLAESGGADPLAAARNAALDYTNRNRVLGQTMSLDASMDITFGRAQYDDASNSYAFTPTNLLPDAVRIQVRHTQDSPNGSVPLYFARIFGITSTEMSASAIAVMVPRDIAIVADLSGSHSDDSELRNINVTDINLQDVWNNIPVTRGVNGVGDGFTPPPPGDPANPALAPTFGPGHAGDGGNDPGTNPAGGQYGATFGRMYFWGDTLDGTYTPATDPALMNLPRYQSWNDQDLVDMYQATGYSADEITALMSSTYDSESGSTQHWANRTAVALGLARWDSGMPGGLWETTLGMDPNDAGNGNNWVGGSEIQWLVDYPYPSGSWSDYIYNYVRKSNTSMTSGDSGFRYQFGLKTFTNYLLERKYKNSQTPDLANTPMQPMQAVKDAVNYMVGVIDELDSDDQLSLEIYGTTARHEVDLTQVHSDVSGRLNEMQAGHYDSWTNMGGGLARAVEELTSSRARGTSTKMIILLTDGNANVTETGQAGNTSGGSAYAVAQAQVAADLGFRIFAVSVGSGANLSLMDEIADIGLGEHFHAEGSIEEYSAQLSEIFRRLGGTRPVELIQ